jgi:hypothetical protein
MAERESSIEVGNDRTTGQGGGEVEASRGDGILGVILAPIVAVGTLIGKAWDAITSDGMLAAAGRQGLDELGAALKPFPDSIQVHETGTIWNPTPGEVASNRELGGHDRSTWSSLAAPRSAEAAEHNRHQPGNEHGHDNGQDYGMSM